MLTVDEAQRLILAAIRPLAPERVPLAQARGRVLAEAVASPRDLPPWDNAALDGYAVRAADVASAIPERPVVLEVIATVPAGSVTDRIVGPGQAVRIMTGAPMPRGADAIVMVERTRGGPDAERVEILEPVPPGEAVRRRGEDVRAGEVVLPEGRPLRAGEIGLAASLGCADLPVRRRPVVALLSTGDELVEPGRPLPPGSIYSSNTYALMAMVEEAGGVPLDLGIGRDDPEDLEARLRAGIERADAVITSGGVSVGDFDHVRDVFARIGGDVRFWKVAMRPGKPNAFGTLGGVPLFGLPGNPVSTLVSFLLFVRPALLAMQGRADVFLPFADAVLEHDVRGKRGLRFFLRGVLRRGEDGGLSVRTTGPQGSGILRSMAEADALVVVPEDVEGLPAGARARVLLLPGGPVGSSTSGMGR